MERWFRVMHRSEESEGLQGSYAAGPTWYWVVERARAILGTRYVDVSSELHSFDEVDADVILFRSEP